MLDSFRGVKLLLMQEAGSTVHEVKSDLCN